MARVAIATVSTAAAMNCPGSSAALFHAGMELTTTAQASCDTVKAEINARLSGQNGWYDQHNRGTYSGTADAAQRVTGDNKYTDKMVFTLSGSGNTCQIEACSESQSTSFADFGTNYCNLKLLVCGSDQGCNVANSDFSLGSENTKGKAGASVDMSACLAVSELKATDTCTLYQISDDGAVCGESSLSCAFTGPAKLAEPGLKDGNCADQGYTVMQNTETKSYPVIGDITITEYGKASVQV